MNRIVAAALFAALSGCRHGTYLIAEDRPLTVLPTNIGWCEGGPRQIAPTATVAEPAEPIISAQVIQRCSRLVTSSFEFDWQFSRGSIDFTLDVGAQQSLDMCVVGGNFGEVTDFVECVVDAVKSNPPKLPAGKYPWRLTYMVD